MSSKTVADHLAQTLIAAGVSKIWGVSGDSLNGLTDSLDRLGKIKWMHTRHEEVAAFAAGAEAATTGQLAVCAGSCGPGNLHLINGLYDCHRSRVPVLAIAAQIPSSEIGLDYFQETHPTELFKECSFFVEAVSSAEQFPKVLERAMRAAISQRGVAVIVIPGDVALSESPDLKAAWVDHEPALVTPTDKDLQRIVDLLDKSKAVTILAGAGCAGAHDQVVALAEKLNAPVVHALRGKQYIEYANPYDVGMTGLIGFSSGYHAMMACDTLLILGSSFPYRNFYPDKAKVIQIDIDPTALGRRVTLTAGVAGGIKETVDALLPKLKEHTDRRFLDKALDHYAKSREELDELATPSAPGQPIHPQYLTRLVDAYADADAIFTVDVGTPTLWAARYLTMNGKRSLIGSFNHGSMANAMPQALGAKAAQPQRQVVALCGDGGLSMLLGDLLSIRQLNLPIKMVVFNNSSLGFVAMEMQASGYVPHDTDFDSTSFANIAIGAGILGIRVEDSAELPQALKRAFEHPGPVLVDVVTAKQELGIPPKIKLAQAKGFSLFMLKAVMNGKADQVLELAKTNLR